VLEKGLSVRREEKDGGILYFHLMKTQKIVDSRMNAVVSKR
jgi:hypothetical protein